jgi:ketosteroid isomerase-like protein
MLDRDAIVRAVFAAYVAKDRAAIERLIAPDFHFTSPLDNRIDRATYFERCWPNSAGIEGFDFVRFVAGGDQVAVTYEGHVSGGKRFRNTEVFTLRGDQVVDVEVYFGWSLPHPAPAGGFVDQA